MSVAVVAARRILTDVEWWSRLVIGRSLRAYQLEVARAIVDSVLNRRGLTLVAMMARQSGKNEISAQVEAMLLALFQRGGGSIVKCAPTFRPQIVNSMRRLLARLDNPWTAGQGKSEQGYIVRCGKAEVLFFSAEPSAQVVGGTASILLECDEAQDVDPEKWDKDFLPMVASTNATRMMWGTAWTKDTLLARELARARAAEERDGVRRAFVVPWQVVEGEVPEYGKFVRGEMERMGAGHPLVRTQYEVREIDGGGGLFQAARCALMRGSHARALSPVPGRVYALLIDVAAGGENAAGDTTRERIERNPRRDATAVTVVEVDLRTVEDVLIKKPTYRVVNRWWWLGVPPTQVYARVVGIAEAWSARWLVVDATGVGEGLASFLAARYGDKVLPLRFNVATKSALGWDFVGVVETGRYQDYVDDGAEDTRQFWYEVSACEFKIMGSEVLRWGVWESPRYDGSVARGHDDLLLSAALCSVLDRVSFVRYSPGTVVTPTRDVIDEADRGRF